MKQKYWHIEGYDSFTKIFDKKVKTGYFSENQIKSLLMALAAKASLNFNEIVGAYAKKNSKISHKLLYVHKNEPGSGYMCGVDPVFYARVVTEEL